MPKREETSVSTSLGRVSGAVLEMLERQVRNHGIVVWYDRQKSYPALVGGLQIPGVTLLCFRDSFFRLREELEPFLEFVDESGGVSPAGELPPSVVLYVPLERSASSFALIEAETAGTVLEPHAANPDRDSRLGRIVQQVFDQVAPAKSEHLARQADSGLLTLEELDRIAGEAASPGTGTLQIVFGNVAVEEILLRFVASGDLDQKLLAKNALRELSSLASSELGFRSAFEEPDALRSSLRRFLLVSDFILSRREASLPESLGNSAIPGEPAQRDSVLHLCKTWRNRFDMEDAYVEAAERVEMEMKLGDASLTSSGDETSLTFPAGELARITRTADALAAGQTASTLHAARDGVSSFWSRRRPAFQLAWKVLESGSLLLNQASVVEKRLRQRKWTFDELVEAYASHAEPWIRLERHQRDFETRHARFESTSPDVEMLESVVSRVRDCYLSVSALLAETYARAACAAGFSSKRFVDHGEVFRQFVAPFLEQGRKTALVFVDALRFEMADQLIAGLEHEFDVNLRAVLGKLPGVTPVGMAALLPGAENGLSLEEGAAGPQVILGGKSVGARKDRLAWLAAASGVAVCTGKLGEVLKPAFTRKKEFASAQLVVVTSQEIDLLGEEGDEENIRLYLEDVLEKLRRGVRVLAKAGVERFVLAADHGFLYLPNLDPGLRMAPPGGETAELHERVWIGRGGSAADGYLRVKASDIGLGGPFEFAFPLGTGVFRRKGGAGDYCHGGLSPAEHVLPLLTLVPRKQKAARGESKIRLSLSKSAITNRLFSITVALTGEGLFPDAERRIGLEVLEGQKEAGAAVTAGYGFDDGTREVVVKADMPNVVTLMLSGGTSPSCVTVRAVDCETQAVLDTLKNIPVQLAF